jgi:hypothetical protein
MADEPDNAVHRLLREILAVQQTQNETLALVSESLAGLGKRFEDLYKTLTDTLAVAVSLEAKQ